MSGDSVGAVVIKKSLPRLLVRAFIWLLSLFAVGGVIDYFVNHELRAENERIAKVNAKLMDSLGKTLDSLEFQSSVVGVLVFENDSLRDRTGPIRWRTVVRDTGTTRVDSIPFVVIGDTTDIPVAVGEELASCRMLSHECDKLRRMNDSLIAFVPTVIDSLEHQVDVLDQIANGKKWNLIGLRLPKPQFQCGAYGGYRITGGSGVAVSNYDSDDDDRRSTHVVSSGVSKWNILLGCGIGFNLGIL